MNECRKSISTQELLQENHSLMFWLSDQCNTNMTRFFNYQTNFKSYWPPCNHAVIWNCLICIRSIRRQNQIAAIRIFRETEALQVGKNHIRPCAQKLSSYPTLIWRVFYINFKLCIKIWDFRGKYMNCERKTRQISIG